MVELLNTLDSDASYYEEILQQVQDLPESTQCNRLQKSVLWDNFSIEKTANFRDGHVTIGHFLEVLG